MNDEQGKIAFRLLGPLSVSLNGVLATPSAAKQRQIVALLALNAGHMVSVSTLVEELWANAPPPSAATTLQTYILQLRNRLSAAASPGDDARAMISTRHGGYMLEPQACQTDASEFAQLTQKGRAAAESGEHPAASDLLGRALALWRGSALADIPLGPVLELEATSLEEARLGVLERRIRADLALQRHTDVLGELLLLTSKDPMNENFCALLMTALYRSGHVARALDAFSRMRATLRDELAIEPGPRLQRLQHRILSGDPALETGETTAVLEGPPGESVTRGR
jgi:DNA-binding SARP family transcriptional activator